MKYACLSWILLLALAACDTTAPITETEPDPPEEVPDTTCPPAPTEGQVSYFPLEVGQVMTFAYEAGDYSSGGSERVVGTLQWEVLGRSACENGQRRLDVRETVEGRREVRLPSGTAWADSGAVRQETMRTFVVGDSLDLGAYTFAPIPWIYDEAAPDTLAIEQDPGAAREPFCRGGGRPCRLNLTLKQGTGLLTFRLTDFYSTAGSAGIQMQRQTSSAD